jgi:hypothetical protein
LVPVVFQRNFVLRNVESRSRVLSVLKLCAIVKLNMILLLGDSNLRQTFEEYGEQLKSSLDCDIVYEQTSHNETIKAALEKERDPKPTVIYINSILNEISNKVSRGKAIVDVIKNVTLGPK